MAAMWHIRKMLFMLLLNSVQSLTVLTFCAQWMVLAALLFVKAAYRMIYAKEATIHNGYEKKKQLYRTIIYLQISTGGN